MRTIERDIVAIMIFSKDGKLFLGKKEKGGGGVYADCWHIPGGGVEAGETKLQATVREMEEETGIRVTEDQLELVDNEGRGQSEKTLRDTGERVVVNMHFEVYKVALDTKADETEVRLEDDLAEFQWVDLADLKDVKLTPPSVELFTKLGYL